MIAVLAAAVAAYICFDALCAVLTGRLLGVPGLGSTPAFALHGCDYLAWAAAATKSDFSISLMFETYTFLNLQSTVRYFCCASRHELALQPAVQHFTQKNFGLSSELWSEGEAKPAHVLRKLLSPGQLATRNTHLCRSLLQLRHQYFSQPQVDLAKALPAWVMHATAEALFGERFLGEVMPAPVLIEHLRLFDAEFEGAASPLPGTLFPGFRKARTALLAAFREAIRGGALQGTIAEAVYRSSGVPEEQHANTLLALLWAGLTNVSVTVFWAAAFLLLPEHARWRHSVQHQMAAGRAAVADGASLQDTVDAMVHGALSAGEASVVHCCVSEALRLRAQGIVLRRAVKTLRIPQHGPLRPGSSRPAGSSDSAGSIKIPAGRLVAISPYQIHHDPRFFQNPTEFNPDRHCTSAPVLANASTPQSGQDLPCESSNSGPPEPGGRRGAAMWDTADVASTAGPARTRVAFGAGPFRCPGRGMAMSEAALAVGIFFSCYSSRLPHGQERCCAGFGEGVHAAGSRCIQSKQGAPCSCRGSNSDAKGLQGFASGSASATGPVALEGAGCGAADRVATGGNKSGVGLQRGGKVPRWLGRHTVPGEHVVARGVRSGDAAGVLPVFEPRLLVGVKKPVGALWADCRDI